MEISEYQIDDTNDRDGEEYWVEKVEFGVEYVGLGEDLGVKVIGSVAVIVTWILN